MGNGSGAEVTRYYHKATRQVTSDIIPDGHEDGHSVLLVRGHRHTGTLN